MIKDKMCVWYVKFIVFGFLSLPLFVCAQHTTHIKGKVGRITGAKVWLSYNVDGVMFRDSTHLKNGKFAFKVDVEEAVPATLRLEHLNGKQAGVFDTKECFLEPGIVEIWAKDSLLNADFVKGSQSKDYALFREFVGLEETKRLAGRVKLTKDEAELKWIQDRRRTLVNNLNERYAEFVTAYPDSYFSVYALNYISGGSLNVALVEPLFGSLTERLRNSPEGKELRSQIEAMKTLKIGELAPDFVQADTAGVPIRLSDYRGKYVLLDFWASWCGPCRQDNPNLVKAYQKYKDNNFTILGVSLDFKQKAWIDAIENDGLVWTNVSDLGYFKNKVAMQYAIRAVPQNYLIDPDGRIVALGLHGAALEEILAELLVCQQI